MLPLTKSSPLRDLRAILSSTHLSSWSLVECTCADDGDGDDDDDLLLLLLLDDGILLPSRVWLTVVSPHPWLVDLLKKRNHLTECLRSSHHSDFQKAGTFAECFSLSKKQKNSFLVVFLFASFPLHERFF